MPNALPTEEPLTKSLSLTVCLDLAKRERKCLLYSTILWITSLTFIALPPEPPPDEINPAFLERLFSEEQLQFDLVGRLGDSYRSLLPELLYHYIKERFKPISDEIEHRLSNTDFTGVAISTNSLPIPPAGGSSRGMLISKPTTTQKAEFERLNRIQYILESQQFAHLDAQVVDFYRDYFLGFEAPLGSPVNGVTRKSPPYGRLFEGGTCPNEVRFQAPNTTPEELRPVVEDIARDLTTRRKFCPVEIDSQGAFAFFERVDISNHQSLFESTIAGNRLLSQKYRNAYVYAQAYEIPLLQFGLRRSWIVWLLPVMLSLVVLHARSLARIRLQLLRQIAAADDTLMHNMALLVRADTMSLYQQVGWSAGRLVSLREAFRGMVFLLFAALLLITPLLNIVISGSPFGVASLDDAEGLLPTIYLWLLGAIVVCLVVLVLVKSRRSFLHLFRRMLRELAPR